MQFKYLQVGDVFRCLNIAPGCQFRKIVVPDDDMINTRLARGHWYTSDRKVLIMAPNDTAYTFDDEPVQKI